MIRLLPIAFAVLMAACAAPATAGTGRAAHVTDIVVRKSSRELFLMAGDRIVRHYAISLGFNPTGPKIRKGDGRTPEGRYRITHKNPQSRFHLSLGISYPDRNDVTRANHLGVAPGGDIFLHGLGRKDMRAVGDWTAGCIAVTDREIEEIYRLVGVGTPITILP